MSVTTVRKSLQLSNFRFSTIYCTFVHFVPLAASYMLWPLCAFKQQNSASLRFAPLFTLRMVPGSTTQYNINRSSNGCGIVLTLSLDLIHNNMLARPKKVFFLRRGVSYISFVKLFCKTNFCLIPRK